MELHTCLWNDVDAFTFSKECLADIQPSLPGVNITIHENAAQFLATADSAEVLLTWEFPEAWYELCPRLTDIFTPAAGTDWVNADPNNHVSVTHGAFHGPLLAESLLSALLFMNHQMPRMLENFTQREWNRNIQTSSRLLADQTVLIVGCGNIGRYCAKQIQHTGARVLGVTRTGGKSTTHSGLESGLEIVAEDELERVLPEADHVVLLLPGESATDRYMTPARILACKPGAMLYNFGRGNALASIDLAQNWQHLGGAFLDVTDVEPLPPTSPLWNLPNIMITPHSSCVYDSYKKRFVTEVIGHLTPRQK
ncbi:MAG: D-2-hydroxyacid dehydrogenase (NADP+) [Candidatus Azotimanducaceae bacterium]|jgi:D-2-hydroxyacid dehydrogenase (NADP+)